MSSHHIVREKQEPALLVLGLDNFQDELLGQLLEWSPTLVVTADTAEQVNAFGIKYDIVIDAAVNSEGLQSDVKRISTSYGSPTEDALRYLISNNYPAVNIITNEFVLDEYLAYAHQINMVIYCRDQKIYPVTNGFSKWKPAGETIEVLSNATNLQTTGLEQTAPNQYQTIADGLITLQFTNPFIFITEGIA